MLSASEATKRACREVMHTGRAMPKCPATCKVVYEAENAYGRAATPWEGKRSCPPAERPCQSLLPVSQPATPQNAAVKCRMSIDEKVV